MPPVADIAAPNRMRRLGPAWFLTPLLLVAIWLMASPHHTDLARHLVLTGVAAGR